MKEYSQFSQKPPPGFVWLCYSCTEGLCSSHTPLKKTAQILDQTPQATDPQTNDTAKIALDNHPTAPPINEISDKEDQNIRDNENQNHHNGPVSQSNDTPHNPNYPPTHPQSRTNTDNPMPTAKPHQLNPSEICKHFANARCRHGIRGTGCPNGPHPQVCPKFMRRGTYGCNQGSRCNKYHPKLCIDSIHRRKCVREDCKYLHIKGTIREDYPEGNGSPYQVTTTQNRHNPPNYVQRNDQITAYTHPNLASNRPPSWSSRQFIPPLIPRHNERVNLMSTHQPPNLNPPLPLSGPHFNYQPAQTNQARSTFLNQQMPPKPPPEKMLLETISRLEKKMDMFQTQLRDLQHSHDQNARPQPYQVVNQPPQMLPQPTNPYYAQPPRHLNQTVQLSS